MSLRELRHSIGVLEEQGRWQSKKLDSIEKNAEDMNKKIDSLLAFKWKAAGVIAFASFMFYALLGIARAIGG